MIHARETLAADDQQRSRPHSTALPLVGGSEREPAIAADWSRVSGKNATMIGCVAVFSPATRSRQSIT